ncbi:MAG: hypothetical protein HY366_02360, partial [Candidatus Aenigmarchaeota archaeon]|nr:hypothetical protein [Candidatus Aenigmarchaeota archaeon]
MFRKNLLHSAVFFLVVFACMTVSSKTVLADNVDGTDDGFDKGWSETTTNFGETTTCTIRFFNNASTNQIGSFDHPESSATTRSPIMLSLTSSFPTLANDDGDTCTYQLFNSTNVGGSMVFFSASHNGGQGEDVNENVTVNIGNFSFAGVFKANVSARVHVEVGNRISTAASTATLGVAPYVRTASPDSSKINFFKTQRVALTLGQTGADSVLRFRNITWNMTENNVYVNDFNGNRLGNVSTSMSDVTLRMANFTPTATEANDKRLNFTAWGGNSSGGGALHFRFTTGSANSTAFNLTRQLTCSALSTDFSTYNRGETPITSGTIQDVNGAPWNTSVGDRFNYTLVNVTTVQNTSVDFTVSNGAWAANTRIPTYANASTSHTGFAYKLNFTNFVNTTPLSNYNFCTYVNAYNVSRGLFCDAHAQ